MERRRSHDWLARGLRLVRFHRNWSGAALTVWVATILPPLAAIAAGASGVGTRDTTFVGAGVGGAWPVDNLGAGLMVAMQWRLLMGVCRTPSTVAPADVDSGNGSESPTGAAAWTSLLSLVPPSSTL